MGIWGKSLGVIPPHLVVVLLVVIVPFAAVLAACGSSGVAETQQSASPTVKSSESPSVVGTYRLTNPDSASGAKAKMALNHDMTAKMVSSGMAIRGTYEVADGRITVSLEVEGEKVTLVGTVKGTTITFEQGAIWVRQD